MVSICVCSIVILLFISLLFFSKIFNARKTIRVLSVGPGSGDVDHYFLNEIVKTGKDVLGKEYSVLYQVVEPSNDSIEYFRRSILRNDNYSKINFQWYHGCFEDFVTKFEQGNKGVSDKEDEQFDFVHYVRCFYYFDSVTALDKTYNTLLRKNGFVTVVGENGGAFWPKFMIFLNDHGMSHEGLSGSGPFSMAYFLPGWVSQSQKNKWKYETYTDKYKFNMTPMFDEKSEDGNYIIDFCMHVKDARKTVKKEILNDFFKFLIDNIQEEEIEENEKKIVKKYFPCELGVIVITKE